MKRFPAFSLICLSLCLSSVSFAQGEFVYETSDPALGFTVVSYHDDRPDERLDYLRAMVELKAIGANHVNLAVFRRVDENGMVDLNSGPELQTISFATRLANRLGLKVTLTPIFETATESGWRGAWDPTGQTLRNFRASYLQFVRQLAWIGKNSNAETVNVGSELQAFVNRRANQNYLKNLVRRVRDLFKGAVGYNANFDNYQSLLLKTAIWDNPEIANVSVSLYPHLTLASEEESDRSDENPDLFAQQVQQRWSVVVDELEAYARTLKEGEGMPVVIGEFGAVPYNRSAAFPWSHIPDTAVDQAEQEAVIMGLIRAVNNRGAVIPEITLWQWGTGDHSDNFGINPFIESAQQDTAIEITNFLQTSDE
ncbi:hypothetical protein OAG71_00290 [bacterium]|nr:hypothetical protein [bacterium]